MGGLWSSVGVSHGFLRRMSKRDEGWGEVRILQVDMIGLCEGQCG